jgi:hypothetical protein
MLSQDYFSQERGTFRKRMFQGTCTYISGTARISGLTQSKNMSQEMDVNGEDYECWKL